LHGERRGRFELDHASAALQRNCLIVAGARPLVVTIPQLRTASERAAIHPNTNY